MTRLSKRLPIIALAIMLGLGVAACGKKGPLEPPSEDGKSYPRTYPNK
ncbi:lipoprotein [Thalassospira sp.]|nr:lipoprotein [Thalassospira sp.]MDP2698815.1 lipoprotein [Thalassospira sp.]